MNKPLACQIASEPIAGKHLFNAVANELSKLHLLAENLQGVCCNNRSTETPLSLDSMKTLQSLDYLTQSLTALSAIMDEVSNTTPMEWNYDALNSVDQLTLHDLRASIMGNDRSIVDQPSSGDCNIFD